MILTDYFRSEPDVTWSGALCAGVTHGTIRLPDDTSFDPTLKEQVGYVCDRFRAYGIKPLVLEPLPDLLHSHIKLGDEKRDESIEKVIKLFANLKENGITTVCFNFMAHYGWTRTAHTRIERGGAHVTGFRLADFEADGFSIDADTLWKNYRYFINAILPHAKANGIRLALHPDDPPLESLGKTARIFTSLDNIKRAVEADSDHLGVTFCQACYYLMGENLEEAVKTLADKIFFIHFRNVRGVRSDFYETFHDNGAINMKNMLELYTKNCMYNARNIPIRVDHVPTLPFENGAEDGYDAIGRQFALGYLKGLLEGINEN